MSLYDKQNEDDLDVMKLAHLPKYSQKNAVVKYEESYPCSATNIFSHLLLRCLQIQVPETQEYLPKLASCPSETSAINGLSDRNLYLILFDLKNSLRVLLVSVELPAELRKENKLISTPY